MNAKHALLIVTLAATVFAGAAGAQTAPNDTLFQQLGARPGLVALTDAFMVRLLAVFKSQFVDQLCEVSGGPCKFKGKDMKTVHEGQDITRSNFNALVEVLQQSMDAQGIPFGAQNRLLAQLAPMHREIINAP